MKSRTALAALTAACLCMGGVATAQAQSSSSSEGSSLSTGSRSSDGGSSQGEGSSRSGGSSDDGKSPITSTVRVTAPAVTVTASPTTSPAPTFTPGGPSSDFIARGILDDETKEIFDGIQAVILLGTGLLQLGVILVEISPRWKAAMEQWLASLNIKVG